MSDYAIVRVLLRHTGLPARQYTARATKRATKRCGECLQVIAPGQGYTLRAPMGNRHAKEPRCYACVPWVSLDDAASCKVFALRSSRGTSRQAARREQSAA